MSFEARSYHQVRYQNTKATNTDGPQDAVVVGRLKKDSESLTDQADLIGTGVLCGPPFAFFLIPHLPYLLHSVVFIVTPKVGMHQWTQTQIS